MPARLTCFLVVSIILAACGGGGSTTSQSPGGPTTAPGGATTAPSGQPTQPVAPGDAIDSQAVAAAIAALQAKESWRFEVDTITEGLEGGVRSSVSGVQRTQPESAVDAQHFQPVGEPFRYVRIGDDIWFDVGTGTFTQVEAADSQNLIEQYEPYYLQGLADSAVSQDWQYEPVGTEVVNTIETMHYRLSEGDLENIVETTELTPDQWGGDVWIATDGGYLVQLAWGPQRPVDAMITVGFFYDVSDVDCECPVEPPE